MTEQGDSTAAYGRYYYSHCCDEKSAIEYGRTEHWLRFFGYMAERLVSDIHPSTVLDAGCAMGFLVEALRDRGVDAYGIDVSVYALEQVRTDIRPFCTLASVNDPLGRRYDLITCIETLEHLPPLESEKAVANLCAHTDDVVFSSTPSNFKEATHHNVRGVEYWAELFARHGLHRDVDYDPSTFIAPWAARFRRRGDPPARIAADYERALWRLKVENHDLRELALERQTQLDMTANELEASSAQLAAASVELKSVHDEVARIKGTFIWRLAARVARTFRLIAPRGSRRRR